ncbi:MAG: DNA polymerase/3'-5' exonuclease PolX [Candidatus Aenigmarchaeota archaeon]|nr:DNA polymerase/3'-5' exonuclease PolX [Candidatus Aenigmarchaeota archaeon]
MRNSEIARVLRIISVYEDMMDGFFKARAYDRAARAIESLTEEAEDIYRRGGKEELMKIPGIGLAISEKIGDLIETGRTEHLEELKKRLPVDVEDLMGLEGVGPKTIKTLWQKLKIRDIAGLEKAARGGKIRELPRFGEKSEADILRSIEFKRKHSGRFLLGQALPVLEEIRGRLAKVPGVKRVIIAGSARRMRETIGDADFLVATSDPKRAMDFFQGMPDVEHVFSRGKAKVLVGLKSGMDADLQVVEEKSFGAASQYFTGNKDHNVALRRIAISKGMKLNEYGLYRGDRQIAGSSEEEVYEKLGLEWVPPEMRENLGEVETAAKGKMPDIIPYGSLRGDLQTQTSWTDGSNSIMEMASRAKELGMEYMAVTDHSKRMAFTGGLDERKLERQAREIDTANKKMRGFTILKGIEVDILRDGKLDLKDSALKKLDIVGASIHSSFNLSRKDQTERLVNAMENQNVDIIFHPTAREIQKREPCDLDMDAIFDKARETGTILEVNAMPNRLDLRDDHIRAAKEMGCKFSIDSDAHALKHFDYLLLGVGQARRGWLEKKDVINTLSLDRMLKELK